MNGVIGILRNVTICDNTGGTYKAGLYLEQGSDTTTVENSIIRGNQGDEVYLNGHPVAISYSDVEGGYTGEGNFDENPLFVQGYYLSHTFAGQPANSPCKDAGDPDAEMIEGATITLKLQDRPDMDCGYHYPLTGDGYVP